MPRMEPFGSGGSADHGPTMGANVRLQGGAVMSRWRAAFILVLLCSAATSSTAHAEGDSIEVIVDAGSGEPPLPVERPSLELDSNGHPVVAYWADGVWLAHCNDPFCAGDDESVSLVEQNTGGTFNMALALDADGNPIVTYASSLGLRVVHCNDPDCSGGDETMNTFEAPATEWVSLELDAAGNPVIAYEAGVPPLGLRLLHCNDPDCAGGDEIVNVVQDPGGTFVSLALDGDGFPVMVYDAWMTNDLRLLRCNDPACAGGDEYVTSLRATPTPTVHYTLPALVLDAADHPVISYVVSDAPTTRLMVMHCDDPDCTGGGESVFSIADITEGGPVPSLALDPAGNPVVAYSDDSPSNDADDDGDPTVEPDLQTNLVVAHCTNPDCANVDRSLVNVDPGEQSSWDPSLVVDAAGYPVIAYVGGADVLKLARCDDVACLSADGDLDRDGVADVDDNCPAQINPDQNDSDADGLGDVCDPDDDNDGRLDGDDAFPNDPNEWFDTDLDGVGDNADPDDDGDGQSDVDEVACGSNPIDAGSVSPDVDGNGVPDCRRSARPRRSLRPGSSSTRPDPCWSLALVGAGLALLSDVGRSIGSTSFAVRGVRQTW